MDDAAEWDHLEPIMRATIPTGYGHTFGNLVPACARCNRSKLAKPWDAFLQKKAGENYEKRKVLILRYIERFSPRRLQCPEKTWTELQKIRAEILRLFEEADRVVRQAGDS